MSHTPILAAYIITNKPFKNNPHNSNRWLMRNIINQANENEMTDEEIFIDFFGRFIGALDTPSMFRDDRSKRCMTAHQPNLADDNVGPSIQFDSAEFIIEGRVEGGAYGKRRKKTDIVDKNQNDTVSESDAITDNFYFLLYMPPRSNKTILLLQAYSDDKIDVVMKKFWVDFLSVPNVFRPPSFVKYIPAEIIRDFKEGATISGLSYTTEVQSDTLLENVVEGIAQNFKVSIKITPTNEPLSYDLFATALNQIERKSFLGNLLGNFLSKKGSLKDSETNKTSQFDIGTNFEIKPSILLEKYIIIRGDDSDFGRIREYCISLLENLKTEIYPENAVQDR